jgi:diadenosine tetraphosphate (Ap4A) HIT family hydrolase
MSSSAEDCIFCNKTNCKVISSTKHFFIIRDTAYPVTKHHTLIITNRHVDDFFDLTKEEMNDLDEDFKKSKKRIKKIR